jgi:cytochrome P450
MSSFTQPTAEAAGHVFHTSLAYADPEGFHAAAKVLRREAPIHWVDAETVNPFYVVTKYADVKAIEGNSTVFLSNPRAILGTKQRDEKVGNEGHLLKMLVNMDAPEHTGHRQFVADWFRPKNLDALEPRLKDLAAGSVQRMIDANGVCDFARDIAMPFPLEAILAILGLPESDYPRMLKLTQEIFAPEDPEQARSPEMLASMMATIQDFMAYFAQLSAARIAEPTDDLASAIAHGEINGSPISMAEQIGHYVLIATAGHDTTSSAMSGGLLALVQHPDQLQLLQKDPSLLDSAIEEMLRWSSPVKHFMRTAAEDTEVNGTLILAGQDVLLSYWSANFDEDVFDDPFIFDITRSPNKHLAFGFGAHYCLGATLARRELRTLFGELVPRIRSIELAGTPEFTPATFVSGLKRMPIRYELS